MLFIYFVTITTQGYLNVIPISINHTTNYIASGLFNNYINLTDVKMCEDNQKQQ